MPLISHLVPSLVSFSFSHKLDPSSHGFIQLGDHHMGHRPSYLVNCCLVVLEAGASKTVNLGLHPCPHILDGIEIWAVGRPVTQELDV